MSNQTTPSDIHTTPPISGTYQQQNQQNIEQLPINLYSTESPTLMERLNQEAGAEEEDEIVRV